MRKIFVILLSVILLFQINVASSYAVNTYEFSAGADMQDSDILSFLGVNVKSAPTRGDMALMLYQLMGNPDFNTGTEHSFSDVGENDSFYDAVNYFLNMGYISRAETFNPSNPITADEAYKMAVSILGYGERAENMGGFPNGYRKVAVETGLAKYNPIQNTSSFLMKLLEIPYYNITSISAADGTISSVHYEYEKKYDFLRHYRKIYVKEGIVSEIEYGDTGNDIVTVGGQKYTVEKNCNNIREGHDYDLYISYEDSYDEVILFVKDRTNAKDVISHHDSPQLNGKTLSWVDSESNKAKSSSILPSYLIVYNGSVVQSLTENEFADLFKLESGYISLGEDRHGQMYLVEIYSFKNGIVEFVDEDEAIYLKYNKGNIVTEKKHIDAYINGKESSLEPVKQWDVVSYCENLEKTLITAYFSDKTVEGRIDAIDDENGYIGEQAYKYSENILHGELQLGQNYILGLNMENEIVYCRRYYDENAERIGYIVKVKNVTEGIKDDLLIKLLDTDGNIQTYQINEKAKIDSQKISTNSAAETLISSFEDKVILYSLNKDNEIVKIYQSKNEKNSKLKKLYGDEKTSVELRTATKRFGSKFFYDENTVFFGDAVNEADEDLRYYTINSSKLSNGGKYKVRAYETGEDSVADVVVCYQSGGGASTSLCMIKDIYSARIEGDSWGYAIECMFEGSERKFYTEHESAVSSIGIGDVVRMTTDITGKISKNETIYDYSAQSLLKPTGSIFSDSQWIVSGRIEKKSGNVLGFTSLLTDGTYSDSQDYFLFDKFDAYVYDSETDDVYIASLNDIKDYENFGDEASTVVVQSRFSNEWALFIYR